MDWWINGGQWKDRAMDIRMDEWVNLLVDRLGTEWINRANGEKDE
jgi:hypothetical protein